MLILFGVETTPVQTRAMDKPRKPRKDFPLYAHGSGQWAKTIKGKKIYFGVWSDPQAAEHRYLQFLADSNSQPAGSNEGTVFSVTEAFLDAKARQVEAGQLSHRQMEDLLTAVKMTVQFLGPHTEVDSLQPSSFLQMHGELQRRFQSPKGRASRIANIRSIFNWAYRQGIVDKPIRFGDFRQPTNANIRRHVKELQRDHGKKLFNFVELALLLNAAKPVMRAMILLGINCGANPADVKTLRPADIDGEWLDYYRRKAATDRKAWLWPETRSAIELSSSGRDQFVFLTKYGNPWGTVRDRNCPITREFKKLLDALGLYRRGHSFGALRSTYRTWADETKDEAAINFTMGHVDQKVSAVYRQSIGDERLVVVSKHVRSKLFP